jgi:hypothetical protein
MMKRGFMKKQLLMLTIMIIAFGILSGCLKSKEYVIDYYDNEYNININSSLHVSTFNGRIDITTWEGNNIILNVTKTSEYGQDELDLVEINVENISDKIEIVANYLGVLSSRPSVNMILKIPHDIFIDNVLTSNGDISISQTKGNISAISTNGKIHIENVEGYVLAKTSNGGIEIKETSGIRDLSTSNAKISVEVNDIKDDITISTSNGAVDLYLNSLLDINVDMTTSNGEISINDVLLNIISSSKNHINGNLGDGGYLLVVHTSNGDVNLFSIITN